MLENVTVAVAVDSVVVAIGSLPFIYAVTDNTPYRRQTAEFRTQRFDNSRDPGEQGGVGDCRQRGCGDG